MAFNAFDYGNYPAVVISPTTGAILRLARNYNDSRYTAYALLGTLQYPGDSSPGATFVCVDSAGAQLILNDEPFAVTWAPDPQGRLILCCRLLPGGYPAYAARFGFPESEIAPVEYVSFDDGRTWSLVS